MKSEVFPPHEIDSSDLPRDMRIKVTLIARPLYTSAAQKLCRVNIVYSRAERVFILEHIRPSKAFAVAREAICNAHPGK
jgi:hypothetical protein